MKYFLRLGSLVLITSLIGQQPASGLVCYGTCRIVCTSGTVIVGSRSKDECCSLALCAGTTTWTPFSGLACRGAVSLTCP